MSPANRLLLWRIAHKFTMYAPPAVGAGYAAILGIAAQARSGTDARAFFDNQIVMWRAIVLAPYALWWFLGLILFWLLVVIWTGARMHVAELVLRPAPVDRQPLKRPAPHPLSKTPTLGRSVIDGLREGLRGRSNSVPETSLVRAMREAREEREKEIQGSAFPNMALDDVTALLMERIGDDPQKIHDAIVDAAYHKRVNVWGRMVPGGPTKPIWHEAWEQGGKFSLEKGSMTYRSPDNPNAQLQWTGLMFNRAQVYRHWPPDLGPNGWMAA